MSEHLKVQIYASEAEARGIPAKAALLANDNTGIAEAIDYARVWGVHPDVVECTVVVWNDDDPEDEMTEPQGNLTEYAEVFGYNLRNTKPKPHRWKTARR